MSDRPRHRDPGDAADRRTRAGRLTWLVAAAAVLLIAGVGAFALIQRATDDDVPAAGPSGEPADPTTVTSLSVPADAGSAKCAVPYAEILAQQGLAFDGVVDGVTDGMVTLTPTMFYAGEPTDIVRVEAPPEALEGLLLSVQFEVGERYLVSAADGQVSICGYSGAWSPDLERCSSRPSRARRAPGSSPDRR